MIEMLKYVFLLDIACLPTQVVTKLLVRNTLKNRNISALNYSTVECKYRRLMVWMPGLSLQYGASNLTNLLSLTDGGRHETFREIK